MHRLLLLLPFFFFSCGDPDKETVPAPAGLIAEDKMVQVLADVHLLEATLAIRSPQQPMPRTHIDPHRDTTVRAIVQEVMNKEPIGYYDIFKKRGLTRKQFDTSLQWYSSQPEKLNALYDKVIVELTKRQASGK
jgi:hypothetical protein